ncbi:hypothetical protein SAMN05421504_105578 [Amycolatopsis xylanica]|uniref:SH3 domain-containing protein n=1 Tax=Amycolatopsis xylanica TaxID=589385 RepID=A0A1H3JXG1_9PSEU|nr:hypothetical protein [Amycolatopsis xylanica]SDY44647.1 hypothetical protein SAMN05421504_105578 [Amycolatopsis xylanica]
MKTSIRAAVAATGFAMLVTGLGVGAQTAQAASSYPVSTTVDGRTVKDPNVPVGKQRVSDFYTSGTMVTLACQDTGPEVGGSTIWDLTTDGVWVADTYVKTGSTTMVAPKCSFPKSFPAKADLNGRANKGDAATAPGSVADKYKEGASVPVVCQATAGDEIWDKTSDNLWVPDEYVKTGTEGFVSGLPHCDTDGLKPPSSTNPADPRANEAIAFAKARLGHTDWNNQCELFVERAFGTSGRFATALTHYQWQKNNGRIHRGTHAPAGTAVFFTSTTSAGHIMLALGGGTAISTGPSVYQTSSYESRSDYLGWAYVPSSW